MWVFSTLHSFSAWLAKNYVLIILHNRCIIGIDVVLNVVTLYWCCRVFNSLLPLCKCKPLYTFSEPLLFEISPFWCAFSIDIGLRLHSSHSVHFCGLCNRSRQSGAVFIRTAPQYFALPLNYASCNKSRLNMHYINHSSYSSWRTTSHPRLVPRLIQKELLEIEWWNTLVLTF